MTHTIHHGMPTGRVWRLLSPAERLFSALTDPYRSERTAATVLVAYVVVWTLYSIIAKSSQDIHVDMGEVVAWSRDLAWGYPKHPPLAGWLARAWFSVFPLADWSYYLFAMVLATLGIWAAWRLSAHYLDAEKRAIGLALLTLVPFFNFHALKFNVNSILIPIWAATTWWFLRSLQTRSIGYAALAGFAAALSMLGKYWSIVLLAGLALAALTSRERKAYFRSAAPWLTVTVGVLTLAPHLAWLSSHNFAPFDYAFETHRIEGGHDFHGHRNPALEGLHYLAGLAAYIAAPTLCTLAIARPGGAALADTAWPADPARRTALIAFVLPVVLLPIALAAALQVHISSLWVMSGMTLLPIVLLSSSNLAVPRAAAVRLIALAMAVPILAIMASPVIAYVIHKRGVHDYANHFHQLADATQKLWRETRSEEHTSELQSPQ